MMGTVAYSSMYQRWVWRRGDTRRDLRDCLRVREKRGSGYERDVWYAAAWGWLLVGRQRGGVLVKMHTPTEPLPTFPTLSSSTMRASTLLHHRERVRDRRDGWRQVRGWQRTAGVPCRRCSRHACPGDRTVCRFYGRPEYGLDTHFYMGSADECASVQQQWPDQWLLESANVFRMFMPDAAGNCRRGHGRSIDLEWPATAITDSPWTHRAPVHDGPWEHRRRSWDPPVGMCSPL